MRIMKDKNELKRFNSKRFDSQKRLLCLLEIKKSIKDSGFIGSDIEDDEIHKIAVGKLLKDLEDLIDEEAKIQLNI